MDGSEQSQNGNKGGCGCLLAILVAGGLAYGGHWLWENRRDDVLEWKDRAAEWCSSFLPRTEDGDGSASPQPSEPRTFLEIGGNRPPLAPQSQPKTSSVSRRRSDDWWKKGDNWTRTKAENLDDLTDADNELILSWDSRQPEFAHMVDSVRGTLARFQSAPAYSYDRNMFARVQSDVDVVAHCLEVGDPLRLADRLLAMESNVRSFMSSVRWRTGVAHPTAPHVHSGAKENSWEPDDGYVFISSSQNDNNLAVRYRGHAYRCSRCNGSGVVVTTPRCPNCQGKGKVPNPLVQGMNAASAAVDIINAFSKHPRQIKTQQMNDPGIRCDVCGGHGIIRQEQVCPDCENGTVWR